MKAPIDLNQQGPATGPTVWTEEAGSIPVEYIINARQPRGLGLIGDQEIQFSKMIANGWAIDDINIPDYSEEVLSVLKHHIYELLNHIRP